MIGHSVSAVLEVVGSGSGGRGRVARGGSGGGDRESGRAGLFI